jgi:hypothetical protein
MNVSAIPDLLSDTPNAVLGKDDNQVKHVEATTAENVFVLRTTWKGKVLDLQLDGTDR